MEPSRVRLLPEGLCRLYLVPARPAPSCGICGEAFGRHDRLAVHLRCERCGLEFSSACYWTRVASLREAVAFEIATDAELDTHLFLCRGCRS